MRRWEGEGSVEVEEVSGWRILAPKPPAPWE